MGVKIKIKGKMQESDQASKNEVLTASDEEDMRNKIDAIAIVDGVRNNDGAGIRWVVLDRRSFRVLQKGKSNVAVDDEAMAACVEYVSVVAGWCIAAKYKEKIVMNDKIKLQAILRAWRTDYHRSTFNF